MNKVQEAMDFLEARQEGSFAGVIEYALERGGVVHAAPDCFMCGVPCEDAPGVLHVVFQCSYLPALRRVLCALPYERVRWRRDLANRDGYGMRERAIADFCTHVDFGTGLTKKG